MHETSSRLRDASTKQISQSASSPLASPASLSALCSFRFSRAFSSSLYSINQHLRLLPTRAHRDRTSTDRSTVTRGWGGKKRERKKNKVCSSSIINVSCFFLSIYLAFPLFLSFSFSPKLSLSRKFYLGWNPFLIGLNNTNARVP